MDTETFINAFGSVYEHSAWIARQAHTSAPFASLSALHSAMEGVVQQSSPDARMALIRAHPQLLGKLAPMHLLTRDSREEQASAGLDRCSPEELAQLASLNRAYIDKFGFPFVIAVRGLSRHEIIDQLATRLANERETEFDHCLAEIGKIARLRLESLVSTDK